MYAYVKAKKVKKYFVISNDDDEILEIPANIDNAVSYIFKIGGYYKRYMQYDTSENGLEGLINKAMHKKTR